MRSRHPYFFALVLFVASAAVGCVSEADPSGGSAGGGTGHHGTGGGGGDTGTGSGGGGGDTGVGGGGGDTGVGGGSGGGGGDTGAGGGGGQMPPDPCEPACGTGTVCVGGECVTTITGVQGIDSVLLGDPTPFNTNVLISQQPDNSWAPSTIYHYEDFVAAVTEMYLDGIGDFQLYLGDEDASDDVRAKQGLVNLALFLSQSMKETIQYDACDENNWSTGYPLDASCGQLGQDYADYDCEMACPRIPNATISAVTNAKWYGAPGPLFCAPNAAVNAASGRTDGLTGKWNYGAPWCMPPLATEPGAGEAFERAECQVYAGQKAGGFEWDGSAGSVEGCCWWGRGVIQTTGRCNFGMLNHYLGDTHLDPSTHGRPAQVLYPDIDFCANPEVICSSTEHPELKWIAGLFYWMSSVQTYEADGWSYLDHLREYVDGGLTGTALIDATSSIVNRGCHTGMCETGTVDGLDVRRANFEKVLMAMGLH